MGRPTPSPGDMVAVPGHPGELTNPVVLPALEWLLDEFDLWLSDSFGPGHVSEEHTIYGTAADVGPYDNDWYGAFVSAIEATEVNGWTPDYYDGSHGTTPAANHGPFNHLHTTLLTVTEYRGGATPNFPEGPPPLKQGDTGVRVKRLTTKLSRVPVRGDTAHRYIATPTDKFDAKVEQAVKDFQRDHGVTPVDGVVGPKTMKAINLARRLFEKDKTIQALKVKLANIEHNRQEALGNGNKQAADHYGERAQNVRKEITDLGGDPSTPAVKV